MKTRNSWERFFSNYTSKSTISVYKMYLEQFFEFIYGKGTDPAKASDKYLSEKRDYEQDITGFFRYKLNIAPKSYAAMLSIVKTFLLENDVELKQRFWKDIRRMKRIGKKRVKCWTDIDLTSNEA